MAAVEIEQHMPNKFDDVSIFIMPKSVARRYSNEESDLEIQNFQKHQLTHHNPYDHVPWAHKHMNGVLVHKLRNYFTRTLDMNADGVINHHDFELAAEGMIPSAEASRDSRLEVMRRNLQCDLNKYWKSLCEVGDTNLDGNVDQEEWLEVMDNIVAHVRSENAFPEWYEDLIKILFRSSDIEDSKNVTKEEFVSLLSTWAFDKAPAERAYDYITKDGAKKMDYALFLDFMKQFMTNEEQGHPINCGLDNC